MDKQFLNSSKAFVISAVILAVAAGLMKAAIKMTGAVLVKVPIELRKPLDELENSIAPYNVVSKAKIQEEVEESLGTEEYIQWEIEDTEAEESAPTRFCSLFITYYPKADRVPHVPEECYIGGGNRQLSREDVTLTMDKSKAAALPEEIKAKHLVFIRKDAEIWQSGAKYPVMYVFKVNGKFANSRTGVREILGLNLFGEYSYFSKIEWTFYGRRLNSSFFPTKEESIDASNKLMSVLLPVLESEHWPKWEKAD